MPVQFKCTSSWLTLPGLVKFLIKRRQLWLCDVILRAAGNLPSDSDNYDMVWRKGWLQTCSFNLHIMQEETTSKCLQMQRLGGTQRQTDGGTKHPADWSDRNRQKCGGGHGVGVGGGEVRKKLKKRKNPGRQYVPVLWEEPCCASQPLRCLAQHQSMWSDIGCLAHHPVTLFLLWQPQGLTAWLLLRKRDSMRKRGELQPVFVVSEEEISDVKQLKLLQRTPMKISFPSGQWSMTSIA